MIHCSDFIPLFLVIIKVRLSNHSSNLYHHDNPMTLIKFHAMKDLTKYIYFRAPSILNNKLLNFIVSIIIILLLFNFFILIANPIRFFLFLIHVTLQFLLIIINYFANIITISN